jgi:hypothetical protein
LQRFEAELLSRPEATTAGLDTRAKVAHAAGNRCSPAADQSCAQALGSFWPLNEMRIDLAKGRLTPAQIEALRRQLELRQQEMQRFAMFLRACVLIA